VETLFRAANVFRERGDGEKWHEGEEVFPPGKGNISSPDDFVMGETLFRDTRSYVFLQRQLATNNLLVGHLR